MEKKFEIINDKRWIEWLTPDPVGSEPRPSNTLAAQPGHEDLRISFEKLVRVKQMTLPDFLLAVCWWYIKIEIYNVAYTILRQSGHILHLWDINKRL